MGRLFRNSDNPVLRNRACVQVWEYLSNNYHLKTPLQLKAINEDEFLSYLYRLCFGVRYSSDQVTVEEVAPFDPKVSCREEVKKN
jgi:hypothetical protein